MAAFFALRRAAGATGPGEPPRHRPARRMAGHGRAAHLRISLTADVLAACGPPVAMAVLISSEYILLGKEESARGGRREGLEPCLSHERRTGRRSSVPKLPRGGGGGSGARFRLTCTR